MPAPASSIRVEVPNVYQPDGQLLARQKLDDALLVTLAVAQGPHPPELRQEFRTFAERLGAPPDVLAATG